MFAKCKIDNQQVILDRSAILMHICWAICFIGLRKESLSDFKIFLYRLFNYCYCINFRVIAELRYWIATMHFWAWISVPAQIQSFSGAIFQRNLFRNIVSTCTLTSISIEILLLTLRIIIKKDDFLIYIHVCKKLYLFALFYIDYWSV